MLDLVLDDNYFDEHDSVDEFNRDIDDSEIERITRHNKYNYGNEKVNERKNMKIKRMKVMMIIKLLGWMRRRTTKTQTLKEMMTI